MKFVIGDIACIKITGEELMVLETLENEQLSVRRPVNTNDGIVHKVEVYNIFELETIDERRTRAIASQQELASQIMARNAMPASDVLDMGKYVA